MKEFKMIKDYLFKILNKLVLAERSVSTLTISFCLGGALAFSPYVGLQTWLVFPLCWMFGLNVAVTIAGLYLVGNPFTMIPILLADYLCGTWIINTLHLDFLKQNPAFITSILAFLKTYLFDLEKILGVNFCFWCFFVGAHILSLLVFVVLYPIMKRIFTLLIAELPHNTQVDHEINNSK